MNNLFKSTIIIIFLTSCVEVGFRHPQPTKGNLLSEMPKELVAFYSDLKSDSTKNINDLYNANELEKTLDENTLLKKWKGKYFLNEKEDSLWYVIMIIPIDDGKFDTYRLDGGNEKTVEKLHGITKVIEIRDEDNELDMIILDPSPKEFKKIVKSGAFEIIDIF